MDNATSLIGRALDAGIGAEILYEIHSRMVFRTRLLRYSAGFLSCMFSGL